MTERPNPASHLAAEQIPVTAIILTLDEEINIARCLRTLARADDVVIVDSGSTDATLSIAIATRSSVRTFHHPFKDFGDQRNWALEHVGPKHDWILFVDADEFCSTELLNEIEGWLRDPGPYVGGYISGKNYFLGRWLKRAALYPSYQLRLLKRGEVTFIKQGHGQRERAGGPLYYFRSSWAHEPLSKGLTQWIDRHNSYSSEEVELIIELQRDRIVWRELWSADPIMRRRCLKRLAAKLPGRPLLHFLYSYIWRGGMLDGRPGLVYCLLGLSHDINIFAKLHEARYLTALTPNCDASKAEEQYNGFEAHGRVNVPDRDLEGSPRTPA